MKKDASDKLLDSGVVPLFYSETPKHSLVEKIFKKKKLSPHDIAMISPSVR
jgi:hypothetical protein